MIEIVVPVFGKNPKILPGFFSSGWLGFFSYNFLLQTTFPSLFLVYSIQVQKMAWLLKHKLTKPPYKFHQKRSGSKRGAPPIFKERTHNETDFFTWTRAGCPLLARRSIRSIAYAL